MSNRLRIHEIGVRYDRDSPDELQRALRDRLGSHAERVKFSEVVRRSIDGRQRPVKILYSVDVTFEDGQTDIAIPGAVPQNESEKMTLEPGANPLSTRPLVIGGGPAGLFAAYLLAKHGFSPLVLERGGPVEQRTEKYRRLLIHREPDPETNLLFGLGGAGTYSDGKLSTTVRHSWLGEVLDTLVRCGAPRDILTSAKPHIGTDRLVSVTQKMVAQIEALGGTILPNTRMDRIAARGSALNGIEASGERIDAEVAILAIGHSARDTLKMLEQAGVRITPKPFQIGVRVEHPQAWLDKERYGEAAGHPALGAADYKLTAKVGDSAVFSFCMCPGGEIVPTINEPGHLAINGMSLRSRNSPFASSGLVVTLRPEDYGGTNLDDCLAFQRGVEKKCFEAGGSDYTAPAQTLVDFASGKRRAAHLPKPSYRLGIAPAAIGNLLPEQISVPLRSAMNTFHRRLRGYIHAEAVVLAPESRASSPVQITRDYNTMESVSLKGLYPVGEGAGYAGGIMSSALDGLDAAKRIIECYHPVAPACRE